MISKELLNTIWLFIAKNKCVTKQNIIDTLYFSEIDVNKILHLLAGKQLLNFDENNGNYIFVEKFNSENYVNAILINIDVNNLDNNIVISNEEKLKAMNFIANDCILNKKEHHKKHNKQKIMNEINEKNWMNIINYLNKMLDFYKEKENENELYDEEIKLLSFLKKGFEEKFVSYFEKNK